MRYVVTILFKKWILMHYFLLLFKLSHPFKTTDYRTGIMEAKIRAELGLSQLTCVRGRGGGGCISQGEAYETDKGMIFVKNNSKKDVCDLLKLKYSVKSSNFLIWRLNWCSKENQKDWRRLRQRRHEGAKVAGCRSKHQRWWRGFSNGIPWNGPTKLIFRANGDKLSQVQIIYGNS